jgi:hypothetical protein
MTALVITLCVVFFIIAFACVVEIVKEIVEWIKEIRQ